MLNIYSPHCHRRRLRKLLPLYFSLFTFHFSLFSFHSSLSQTPDWVWARSAPNNATGGGEGFSIATDKSNNVYITGEYVDTIIFGSHILTSTGSYAFYLAKYDLSGNVIWAKSAANSASSSSWGFNVCTDVFGNVYVTGYFYDTVSFGSHMLTSTGSYDIFLV